MEGSTSNKELLVSGLIGGITSLTLAILFGRLLHRKRTWKRGQANTMENMISLEGTLPPVIGPYSYGKLIKNPSGSFFAWSSAQAGMIPDGSVASGDDPIRDQALQTLKNLKTLAEANGMDLETHCLKNTVYLADINDFANFNEVYKTFFVKSFPARTCIAVESLPRGLRVGIESILFKPA